jgi:hypothetical protein
MRMRRLSDDARLPNGTKSWNWLLNDLYVKGTWERPRRAISRPCESVKIPKYNIFISTECDLADQSHISLACPSSCVLTVEIDRQSLNISQDSWRYLSSSQDICKDIGGSAT